MIRPHRELVLLLLTLIPAAAQDEEAGVIGWKVSVSGRLEDGEGNPIAGAVIEFVGLDAVFTTDLDGAFGDAKIPKDGATIRCTIGEVSVVLDIILSKGTVELALPIPLGSGYWFHLFNNTHPISTVQWAKPNIYLYPETEADVRVWLSFVGGGRMTASEPPYLEGWDVTVTPEGRITAYEPVWFLDPETGEPWAVPTRGEPVGFYDYLFYEGEAAGPGQLDYGWVVGREEIEPFFREKLAAYGFAGREIEDFCEFWPPRLTDYPFYAVYPQAGEGCEELVALAVFPAPDALLRVAFTVRGLFREPEALPTEPEIAAFERLGFTVVEWGVILKQSDARFYLH